MTKLKLKNQKLEEQGTADFWYDVFDGGYIKPEYFLEPDSSKKVAAAIAVLEEFRTLLMNEDNEIIHNL